MVPVDDPAGAEGDAEGEALGAETGGLTATGAAASPPLPENRKKYAAADARSQR